jgi:hypothetical protein
MRKKLRVFVVSVIVPLLIVSPVAASIDSMLDNVVAGVYTKHPGLIQSPTQSALSGGALSFRLNNSPFAAQPLLTLNPPTMAVSCNGLDFDAGMLSMMNLDLFGDTLTNAGSQLAWGVMIGLVYSLPGIGEAFGKLQDWARKIQSLMQNPCEMGKQVGASIASKWNVKATERATAQTGDSITEVFKDAKKHLKISDIATTFPFNALSKSNIASELWPLITGYFGVMNIYVVNHNNVRVASDYSKTFANACGAEPCNEDNIRVEVLQQPNSLTLDTMMHGTLSGLAGGKGYSCTLFDDECVGGTSEVPINTSGIVTKIAAQLRNIVQSYAAGGNATGMTATLANYNALVPQTQGMVKYAANIYKYGAGNVMDAERIIYALAESIGIEIIVKFFDQIGTTIYSLSATTENTTQKEELRTYLSSIASKQTAAAQYVADRQRLITNANAMFDRYKTYYDMSARELVKRVGPGAMIFGRK